MYRLAKPGLLLSVVALSACIAGNSSAQSETTVSEYNQPAETSAGHYGVGSDASLTEIAGWDIDIRPDGLGLPDGSGTAEDGEMMYEEQCASCHGSFGEGVGRYPVLAGGEGTLTEPRPEKTIGSFWPYASTLWDYIHRAMPFTAPQSLSDDEVYAITAYVLYLNDLVDYDFELSQDNLAMIEMPNKDGFFLDDRPDVSNDQCMDNCKDPDSIKITSEPPPPELSDEPEPVAQTQSVSPGAAVYQKACSVCHAAGIGDAPIPGDLNAWSARLAQGRDALLTSALEGKGVMPPKGGQLQLGDDEVAAAVDFMIEQSAQ